VKVLSTEASWNLVALSTTILTGILAFWDGMALISQFWKIGEEVGI
jgi:hypothetical protein